MNSPTARTTKSKFLWHSLIVVAVTVCGFLLGGGWRIILDYSEWHSEIFMHANGVEEYLSLLNWLASGSAVGALIGAIAGWGLVYAFGKSKPEISS